MKPGHSPRPRGKHEGLVDVGIEREQRREGRLGHRVDPGVGPVQPQVPEHRPEQDDVAQIPAANDKDARGELNHVGCFVPGSALK